MGFGFGGCGFVWFVVAVCGYYLWRGLDEFYCCLVEVDA